jgi:putative transposase
MSTMSSKRRGSSGEEPPEAVADRLAGLLAPEALEDALRGLAPEQITGPGGLLTQLAGRVVETALGAELTEHLGYPPGQAPPDGAPNIRNGSTAKTLKTDLGPVQVRPPRDRDGSFEPQLVAKRQTRLAGLDQRIIGLYAGGMSVRDIAEHLSELYGTEIRRDTISRRPTPSWRTSPRGGPGRSRASTRSSTSTR